MHWWRISVRAAAVALAATPFASCSASDEGSNVGAGGGAASGGNGAGATGAGAVGGVGGIAIDSSGGSSGNAGTGGGGPVSIDDCPGPLDPALAAGLQAGGTPDPAMRWLYPYDGTVWPRGLLAPTLQWTPAASGTDAVYVHIVSKSFEYKGCFGPTSPERIPLPEAVWSAATTQASGPSDPLTVELSTAGAGQINGPLVQTWTVAPGTIKGAIFYNTYSSPQVGNNGAVMRILPGQAQPQPYLTVPGVAPLGPCVSCHALSANGAMLVASNHFYPAGPYTSASYAVGPNPNPAPLAQNLDEAGFAALYPDGSRFMTMGSPGTTSPTPFPNGPGNVVGMMGPKTSRLFDTATGQPIAAQGWSVQYANMPTFSPDGTKIVFNHHDQGNGHSLAVMDFDAASNTFSNLVKIFEDATRFPGWPFFTPDSSGVIFALGNAADFVGSHPARPLVMPSDLWYVDVATQTATPLARAGGYDGASSYLPYPGRDEHWEFFPTVSPVAAGGYFWLFFTSRRNYGNTLVGTQDDPKAKKIWVTAIDIGVAPGTDPSHPAFYLPGQEFEAGNVRAFATLEPCKPDGDACQTGVECCCGACTGGICGCPQGCSNIDEKCETDEDCCDPQAKCINGFCALIVR
jgi:hypothetical protein